jgi:hypothetical protein
MSIFKKLQKGISLPIAIMVLSIILSIALGLTAILITQLKIIREMGYSVVAFYAADTGIEKELKNIIHDGSLPQPPYTDTLPNGASYSVTVVSAGDDGCQASQVTNYCIRSVGTYLGVKRAIEVAVYPINP